MGLFPELKSKKRKTVSEPKGMELMKGLVWTAVGVIGISFLTTSVSIAWRTIPALVGIIFCIVGGRQIHGYVLAYKAYKAFVPTWDAGRGMYDRFAQELNAWHENDIVPTCCDGDTLYFLKLQKERLKKKGLKMTNQIVPVKGSGFGTATLSRQSLWYTTDMTYENIHRRIRFENMQEVVYEREVEQVMYEIIVHTPNDAQLANISTTCPNCGAVSSVTVLEEGCKYCGTHFKIRDLFPRVVNLYFLKNKSTAATSGIVQRTIFFSMLAVFIVMLLISIFDGMDSLPAVLATCFFAAGFGGGVLGLILADILVIFSAADQDGMKHVPFFKWTGSKRKITNTMKRYDPHFSFDKFEGQIVALIRMAVFAEHPEKLACYCAGQRDPGFSDILEMTYTNATCLNRMWMEGSILHMSLRTWWINYSEHQGKIQKTGDCIDVEISRNVAGMEPPGFSITSVGCANCGGSFDAVRQKVCPYCGTEYHMENEGWVIHDMHL